nr:MAG TPA: hypothetical protein [Caudoviricetes sp.]
MEHLRECNACFVLVLYHRIILKSHHNILSFSGF